VAIGHIPFNMLAKSARSTIVVSNRSAAEWTAQGSLEELGPLEELGTPEGLRGRAPQYSSGPIQIDSNSEEKRRKRGWRST
jgi:hypothetical protein